MRLRELRNDAKLSIRDVEKYTGIRLSIISVLETGQRKLSLKYVKLFASFYSVSEDYLLGNSDYGIDVFSAITDDIYTIDKKEFAKYAAKNNVLVTIEKQIPIKVNGKQRNSSYCVQRYVIRKSAEELETKHQITLESIINELSDTEKQELLNYVKEKFKKR